jgi:hypothetical protein
MKRLLTTTVALVAAIGFLAPAQANVTKTVKEGPYGPVQFQDYGTCTNIWADITQKTTYSVGKAKNGVYHMSFTVSGPFTSIAGQAPGACGTDGTDNGDTVKDGVKGKMKQTFYIDVTGGKFNRKAKCSDTCATDYTWDGVNTFVGKFFRNATWTFSTTKLTHEVVKSGDKKLCADKWVADYDPATGTIYTSKGDIANSCG